MSAIFITATGTDIGKTFVASGLIRHLRGAGRPVDALKPVATGFDPAAAGSTDTGVLLSTLGRALQPAEFDTVSPWRFVAPLSPDMAAAKEAKRVDFAALVDFCRRAIDANRGTLLIEGIGGVMVPFDHEHTVLDWIAAINVPVLLVTGSYLGSLSHTLTALDALRRRDLTIKALVLNETEGSTVSMSDTASTLRRFASAVPLVALSRQPFGAKPDPAFAELAALL
jgi:dethiobiotin synthetase